MTGYGTKGVAENAPGSVQRGFTLIEVMTAVALTAGLMLGVIEIFKMSSDAATQTEQASDAFEMGRGVMTQIESDLSMFAPEGYLWVRCQEMDPKCWATAPNLGPTVSATVNNTSDTGRYRFDGLSFSVALAAPTAGQMATSAGANKSGSGAGWPAGGQVAYTFGQRVSAVPSYNGVASPYMGTGADNNDQRGVVLVRKVYLDQFNVSTTGGQVCLGQSQTGTPAGSSLISSALTQNTSMAQAATEYLTNPAPASWVLTPKFRLSPASFCYALNSAAPSCPSWQPIINVPDPSNYVQPTTQTTMDERDNIVCDRVSEFFVEVWNGQKWIPNAATLPMSGAGTAYIYAAATMPKPNYIAANTGALVPGSGGSWTTGGGYATGVGSCWSATAGSSKVALCPDSTTAAGQVTLLRDNMLWLGTSANPINRYDATSGLSTLAADLPPATTPSMVRVTLVVHPHADTTPLASQLYNAPGSGPLRYQGVVFREVFKLSGTNH